MKFIKQVENQFIAWDNICAVFTGKDQKNKGQFYFWIGLTSNACVEFFRISDVYEEQEALCYLEAAIKRVEQSVDKIVDMQALAKDMQAHPQNYGITKKKA